MNIVTATNFIGEINIPNIDTPGVSENLNWFITKYEPKLLKVILGDVFYLEFKTEIDRNQEDIPANWLALRDLPELQEAIANYVYCFWVKNAATSTIGTGEAKPKNENSVPTTPKYKLVRAWNEMVTDNIATCEYLNRNKAIYPTWPANVSETWLYEKTIYGFNAIRPEVFHFKNSLGI